jgi:hypothetical protein
MFITVVTTALTGPYRRSKLFQFTNSHPIPFISLLISSFRLRLVLQNYVFPSVLTTADPYAVFLPLPLSPYIKCTPPTFLPFGKDSIILFSESWKSHASQREFFFILLVLRPSKVINFEKPNVHRFLVWLCLPFPIDPTQDNTEVRGNALSGIQTTCPSV